MQRERDFPLHRHFVHRRILRRVNPALRNALLQGFGLNRRIVRIKEHAQLRFVQILLVFDAGRLLDFVRVVQQHAEVANAADAGFRADRWLAGFDARIAEGAFFRLTRRPVVVDFFVRAAGNTHPPAATFVLVDQHDAVVFAFVDRAGGTARHAGRVQAVFTQTRQIHHEGVFKGRVHVFLDALEQRVFGTFGKFAAQIVFPVRPPFDFFHLFTGQNGNRPCCRRSLHFRRVLQMLVVVGERLVVFINLRQIRVGKNIGEDFEFAALARL